MCLNIYKKKYYLLFFLTGLRMIFCNRKNKKTSLFLFNIVLINKEIKFNLVVYLFEEKEQF